MIMSLKNWKEAILSIGIAIAFVLFVTYTTSVLLDPVTWDEGEVFPRNVFIISGLSGIAGIIAGRFTPARSVRGGLIGGGIILIFYGGSFYWSDSGDAVRIILLALVLVILIALGYKLFNKD